MGYFIIALLQTLPLSLSVKELRKSVSISQSHRQEYSGTFYRTRCRVSPVDRADKTSQKQPRRDERLALGVARVLACVRQLPISPNISRYQQYFTPDHSTVASPRRLSSAILDCCQPRYVAIYAVFFDKTRLTTLRTTATMTGIMCCKSVLTYVCSSRSFFRIVTMFMR